MLSDDHTHVGAEPLLCMRVRVTRMCMRIRPSHPVVILTFQTPAHTSTQTVRVHLQQVCGQVANTVKKRCGQGQGLTVYVSWCPRQCTADGYNNPTPPYGAWCEFKLVKKERYVCVCVCVSVPHSQLWRWRGQGIGRQLACGTADAYTATSKLERMCVRVYNEQTVCVCVCHSQRRPYRCVT